MGHVLYYRLLTTVESRELQYHANNIHQRVNRVFLKKSVTVLFFLYDTLEDSYCVNK